MLKGQACGAQSAMSACLASHRQVVPVVHHSRLAVVGLHAARERATPKDERGRAGHERGVEAERRRLRKPGDPRGRLVALAPFRRNREPEGRPVSRQRDYADGVPTEGVEKRSMQKRSEAGRSGRVPARAGRRPSPPPKSGTRRVSSRQVDQSANGSQDVGRLT